MYVIKQKGIMTYLPSNCSSLHSFCPLIISIYFRLDHRHFSSQFHVVSIAFLSLYRIESIHSVCFLSLSLFAFDYDDDDDGEDDGEDDDVNDADGEDDDDNDDGGGDDVYSDMIQSYKLSFIQTSQIHNNINYGKNKNPV
jgi:hypothetical protein